MKKAKAILVGVGLLARAWGGQAQVVEVHSFTNLNRSISDGSPAGLTDAQSVTSAVVQLSAVRVKLRVVGEFNGDLYCYLRHVNANGTNYCVLLNRPGRARAVAYGYQDAGLDVTFDDAAVNGDIHNYQLVTNRSGGLPLTGSWKPDGRTNDPESVLDTQLPATSLEVFAGADASGEWTLFLADVDSGASNQLSGWEIQLYGTATPIVVWPATGSITYGTALDATQLNASSPVPGTFSYTPAAGAILHAGLAQTLTCVFTPSDPVSYNSVTSRVSLDVLPQSLTITANGEQKAYGDPLPSLSASYSGFVNGDGASSLATPVSFTCAASSTSDVGNYPIVPSGATSPDYTITFVNGTLVVGKASSVINVASSLDPSAPAQPVVFTATAAAPNATPVGVVQFCDGASVLVTNNLSGGQAAFMDSALCAGSHLITARYPGSTNFFGSTNTILQTVASPLQPVPDQTAYVLIPVVLTNLVVNASWLSYPLTFGLGAGAPAGARVRTNGVFSWMPSRAQARSTNVINVCMTDSGSPPFSATNTFTVVVDDYLELSLGRTILLVGQTSSVPVTLVTSVGLTNLQALVQVPAGYLAPLAMTDWTPALGKATLQPQGSNVWQMNFSTAAGQSLQATQQLASLSFLALTNGSAFVPLMISEVTTNYTTSGDTIWRTLTDGGRAVVLEKQPLLEAMAMTNGVPNLTLFGLGGVSYDVLFSPGLPADGWQPIWTGIMPASYSMPVAGLTNLGPTMFFRARAQGGGLP